MKTLQMNQFPMIGPCDPRGHIYPSFQKRFISDKSLEKQRKSHSLSEESETKQILPKKFLYFHENNKNIQKDTKHKIAFPYNALNLCYFERRFGQKNEQKKERNHNFTSNNSIKSFLNSKLKTQPSKREQDNPQMQIYIGKKVDDKRIHDDATRKDRLIFSVQKYHSMKNSVQSSKCEKMNRFPSVLKIKSKKAYFMSRFKSKKQETNECPTSNFQRETQSEDEQNPFEPQFRSKTEDNISAINSLRAQIVVNLKKKLSRKMTKLKTEQSLDPWQSTSTYGESSFKLYQNYFT